MGIIFLPLWGSICFHLPLMVEEMEGEVYLVSPPSETEVHHE